MFLGHTQKSAIYASIPLVSLWGQESIRTRVLSLVRRRWEPRQDKLRQEAQDILLREQFGGEEDFGPQLLQLAVAHSRRKWDLSCLTPEDLKKADALQVQGANVASRLSRLRTEPPLNLRFGMRGVELMGLAFPMVFKIPVMSLRHFVSIHAHVAFNEIRKSGHSNADEIIAYLYEVMLVQHKTALALGNFIESAGLVGREKGDSMLMAAETDAIMSADLIFSYLKACVEKTVALVGAAHGIDGIQNRRTHKQRVSLLREGLDKEEKTPYSELILELVAPENLEGLNTWRSGLLHKKGIANLQPHGYASVDADKLPLRMIFEVMHEQHVKNAAMVLGSLAMLADRLAKIDPPNMGEAITDPEDKAPSRLLIDVVRELSSGAIASVLARRQRLALDSTGHEADPT